MIYKKLGNTELNISSICMGGMLFCDLNNIERSVQIFDKYVELGGNVIDTANLYGKWLPAGTNLSEIEIGKWMKSRGNRQKLIIGTKGGHPCMDTMEISRVNRQDVRDDLEESLNALQTDYVDIYWMHRDDENRPVEEIVDFLHGFSKEGKIRYFGISNWKLDRVKQVVEYCRTAGIEEFLGCQVMWSLADPNWENMKDHTLILMNDELREYYSQNVTASFCYSSQARGFFEILFKAEQDAEFAKSIQNIEGGWLNQDLYKVYYNENNYKRFLRVKEIAKNMDLTITQVALGYLISQPFNAIPIIGSDNVEQIVGSMAAGGVTFSSEILNYLENGN